MAVVVSHIARDWNALKRQVLRQAPLGDLHELRFDHVPNPGREELADLVGRVQKPLIVSCNDAEAFGEYAGGVDAMFELYTTAAEAGAGFVDVDWRLSLDLGELPGKCHRIVSRHSGEGTPEDLAAWHEEVRDVLYEGDVTKLVTTAHSTEDGLRVLRYLRESGGGLIAFCAGEAGAFTRVLAPVFGCPFIYAAAAVLPGEPEPAATAPGQLRANDLHALLPPGGISQETAVLAVVGRPVSGSWSPHVQGMALKAARYDAVYVALEPESLASLFALTEDADNLRGLSVTAPFKEEAFRLAVSHDGESQSAKAANTLVRDRGGWRAANTDVPAVRETLERALAMAASAPASDAPAGLRGACVLVLGTGGAARAVCVAARGGGARVVVAGRDADRARELAREFEGEAVAWEAVGETHYDALVHATPLGSLAHPGVLPVPAEALRPGAVVLDAVYRPLRTPLLEAAVARGCVAVPGGEWFVRQAAAQYHEFTQSAPDEALMRAAFEHALDAGREELRTP